MRCIQTLHKITSQCGNGTKRRTRKEYMHWSITIGRNIISVSNSSNNSNINVDNIITIILPNPPQPPQYLHIKTLYLFHYLTILKIFPITVIIHKTVYLRSYVQFIT
jgi:hypothetical protein